MLSLTNCLYDAEILQGDSHLYGRTSGDRLKRLQQRSDPLRKTYAALAPFVQAFVGYVNFLTQCLPPIDRALVNHIQAIEPQNQQCVKYLFKKRGFDALLIDCLIEGHPRLQASARCNNVVRDATYEPISII